MEFKYSEIIKILRKYKAKEYSDKDFTILAFSDLVEKHEVGKSAIDAETLRFDLTPRISEMCSKGKIQYSLLLEANKKDTQKIIYESLSSGKTLERLIDYSKKESIASELKEYFLKSNISNEEKKENESSYDLSLLLSNAIFYSLKYGLMEYNVVHSLRLTKLKASDKPILLKIISGIIKSKIDNEIKFDIPPRAYDIEDKTRLNQIDDNLTQSIKEALNENYEIVMNVIESMIGTNPLVLDNLEKFYRQAYFLVLSEKKLTINDDEGIRNNSTEIFYAVNQKVYDEADLKKASDLDIIEIKNYLFPITAVIFYKCKFLIPIGREDE